MSSNVKEVKYVEAYRFPASGGDKILVSASGVVGTSGWSEPRLSPRFYPTADIPQDGMWDFDFAVDPPHDQVLEVEIPVSASVIGPVPDWLQGVRVHAEGGHYVEINNIKGEAPKTSTRRAPLPAVAAGRMIVRHQLASFDDSFQPIGLCGGFSVKMKKLRHELVLTVEGPDEEKIRSCIQEATGVGLIAAIIAVYATGGGALGAAVSAFLGHLKGCLGDSFSARIDDTSHWIEWCT